MTEIPRPASGPGDRPYPSSEGAVSSAYPTATSGEIRPSRRWLVALAPAAVPIALIVLLIWILAYFSNLGAFDASNFFGPEWNPASGLFGTQTLILGTMVTALPALAIAMLVSLGVAIASVVYLPRSLSRVLDPFIDLLAGVPSVVFAIWGVLFLAPIYATSIEPWMVQNLGWIPGFQGPISSTGFGILLAGTILVLMVLPITTVLIRDALRTVPRDLVESGLALGATRWEVTRRISLRYAGRGVWAAGLLGFARAIGEAVAVFFLIGTTAQFPVNAYSPTSTLTASILQDFDQALIQPSLLNALVEIALLLTAITVTVNLLGRWFTMRLVRSGGGG
ncbi:MAG: phosphate ABC transporter permease subunit PstC [Thermoplasmata archaeon]